MRPVLHGDLSSVARALLAMSPDMRARALCRMIGEADAADAHVRRTGRLHRIWGNGSLMAAARRRTLAAEPGFDDIDYCRCFAMVLEALIHHRLSPRRRRCR